MERLEFGILVRGIGIDDAVWNHSVFSKNDDRPPEGEMAAKYLTAVLVSRNRA